MDRSLVRAGITALLLVAGMNGNAQHRKKIATTTRLSLSTAEKVQVRKSFYLLYILEQPGAARNTVLKNSIFKQVAAAQRQRLHAALARCGDAPCLATALQWTPDEVQAVGAELKRMVTDEEPVQALVTRLRQEDRYPVYEGDSDTAFIRKAWEDAAYGMNYICSVYLQGRKPRYPRIDSISFSAADPAFYRQVKAALQPLGRLQAGSIFYAQPLLGALKALHLNGRDEASRYEPLFAGQNAAPFARARTVHWQKYRYSVILVPGSGPGRNGQPLDTMGKYRCRLALDKFRQGLAPFIIVSGGHVHPYKTPFSEAVEMKKYLVTQLGVPDDAVIIEPHARHTTTNIRNAQRLMYLFNMPANKPGLIVTDSWQTLGIANIGPRFEKELGFIPYKSMEKISTTENVFLPDVKAWQHDPKDPLDP